MVPTRRLIVLFLASVLHPLSVPAADRCSGVDVNDLEKYHARVVQLEALVTKMKESESTPGPDSSRLHQAKSDLLDAFEKEQCAEDAQYQATKGVKNRDFLQVPLLYVTDRQYSNKPPDYYSSSRKADGLDYGRVDTIIPDLAVGKPLILGANRINLTNQQPEGEMRPPQVLTQSDFDKAIADHRLHTPPGTPLRVLLYVHGYDVSQHEAAVSAATLAVSLKISVVPVFYSWPSSGRKAEYWHDEDTVRTSYLRFLPFLEHLLSDPVDEVIIVCHSMGARIVTPALGELARKGIKSPKLRKVAFAAADIDIEEFNEQWRDLRQLQDIEWNMYESSKDGALYLSHWVHSDRRLGDSDGGLYIVGGADTIDASATASTLQFMGHSYVVHSPAVGADLGDWISQDLPPSSRGLLKAKQAGNVYWRFP